ncbi:hypothetical protein WJX82_007108 [Trebouxia sp. C0006]
MCSLRCSICLESAKDKQDETGWAVLGCGHVFHAHCLQQSLEHKKACPNCRKGVRSAKGAQALFLDLVPAMPMTPLGKGPCDNRTSFASQEAVTALAETLAKRDAELKQHLVELRQTQDALKQQSELCAAQEEEIAGIQHQHQRAHKVMEEDLVQKRKQVLTLKQSIDKQSSSHKLRCDKLVGQVSRLQTDYDRLSLRNDLGLTKCELEQIAKRMAPPSAKGGALVNYWVSAVDARNREYAQLMRKFQVEANLHDASKRSLSEQLLAKQELQEKVAAVKQQLHQMQAKQEQQSTEIQSLKAQLADGLRRTEAAVPSGTVSSRRAAGLPPGDDLNHDRDQCRAANSERAAGNGSGSMSMIRWDATEDQMPAAMRMPPPIADRPRKSLSLQVPKAADDATDEGLTAEEFDPRSKVSRLHLAAEIIAQQRSRMAAELPPMRTATNGLSGARGSKQEPSFARTGPVSFGHRGHQSGDFIVRGADGRGGRATVLRPSNRQAAPVQSVPSFLASGVGKGSKLPVKRKAVGSGSENLKIRHFFAPSHS